MVALIDPSMFSWPYDRELALGLQANRSDVLVIGCHGCEEVTTEYDFYSPHYYEGAFGRAMRAVPRQPARLLQGILHCISTPKLLGRLKEFRPDVIHFQWLPLPLVDGRAMRDLRHLAPIILTMHNSDPFNGDRGNLFQSLGWKYAVSQLDGVIVHTEAAVERALKQGVSESRLIRIPHGLLSKPSQTIHKEEPPFDLLMFGKIRPYKGLDILVGALERMSVETKKLVRVRVIGRPYFDLAPLIDRVKSAGFTEASFEVRPEFIEEREIQAIFASASAVIMPYRSVDASGILSLAIANGVPVIGSRIDGLCEAVEDGSEAILIPPEDPAALAVAIENFVSDSKLRRRLRDGMIAKQAGMPTWEQIAALTLDYYNRVIFERNSFKGSG
jgi:glycosyltransferase involved in cell wall biosynthesis